MRNVLKPAAALGRALVTQSVENAKVGKPMD